MTWIFHLSEGKTSANREKEHFVPEDATIHCDLTMPRHTEHTASGGQGKTGPQRSGILIGELIVVISQTPT